MHSTVQTTHTTCRRQQVNELAVFVELGIAFVEHFLFFPCLAVFFLNFKAELTVV